MPVVLCLIWVLGRWVVVGFVSVCSPELKFCPLKMFLTCACALH